MELVKALLLGIVQGFTEFLPISSSGHLVIGSEILNFKEQGVVFDVFLHLGTLLSVCLVFRREIFMMILSPFQYIRGRRDDEVRQNLRWVVYIIIATMPAVIAGLFLKDAIGPIFSNLVIVYCMLFVTGLLMIFSKYLKDRGVVLGGKQALLMGCAQACAIFPGLSRSGSTIFAGMALGMNREVVARFSFIMSIPAILGAAVLQMGALADSPPSTDLLISIGCGTVASAISGYFAIVLLLDIVRRNRLQWFGYYCLLLSCFGLMHIYLS